MSSEMKMLETKTGKGTVALLLVVMGALGFGVPASQTGNSDKLESISESIYENKESIAVMKANVTANTDTLDEVQEGVSDNSEKLNQIIGQLRQNPHD